MPTTIRPMSIDDFAQVYKLGLRCYDVRDKPYNFWTIREVADHVENYPELCYVADDGTRVVGFALGADSYEVLDDTGHLEWVAVDPDFRRQGLASRLMETVVETFKRMGKAHVVADISSDNPASQGMARKLGFAEGISVTFFGKDLRDVPGSDGSRTARTAGGTCPGSPRNEPNP